MFKRLLVFFFSLVLSVAAVDFATKVIQWDVAMITAAPDGVTRQVIGINGNWPPVPVWVNRHDHIVLQVKNHLNVTITVHTHGIDEVGTTYWDGVDMVTQWYDVERMY
jgi:iron transport multicopper oxidase